MMRKPVSALCEQQRHISAFIVDCRRHEIIIITACYIQNFKTQLASVANLGRQVFSWSGLFYPQAYNNYEGKYQNLNAMKLQFEKLNATTLVREMATKLETMLASKMQALNVSHTVSYRETGMVGI